MDNRYLLGAFALFLSQSIVVNAQILPDNDLDKQDVGMESVNITQKEFNRIIDDTAAPFKAWAAQHGGTLVMNKLWSDSTVNANATQSMFTSKKWTVNMYGGLARRPEITEDGFKLVVCHELGHHFAGYPFVPKMGLFQKKWAANEGQADYFATHTCARIEWEKQPEINAQFRATVDPVAKEKCDAVWSQEADQNLCYRTAAAGLSLSRLLNALRAGAAAPQFGTPDGSVVKETDYKHPVAQCRLDTYLEGALCTRESDPAKIPGKVGRQSGRNTLEAEAEAAAQSCMKYEGFDMGTRPACWFKQLH